MKKKILIAILLLSLVLSSCILHYDPSSLGYGEVRHEGLSEGSYELRDGKLIYSLEIEGNHQERNGAYATLSIYSYSYLNSEPKHLATFYGRYRHRSIIYPYDYTSRYYTYHSDELVFESKSEGGFSSYEFNGRIKIAYDSPYYESGRLYPRPGRAIAIIPLDDFNNEEIRRGWPSYPWYYLGQAAATY